MDLPGYDFSNLSIRQAYLQGKRLVEVNFSGAAFAHTSFTGAFGNIMALAVNPTDTCWLRPAVMGVSACGDCR